MVAAVSASPTRAAPAIVGAPLAGVLTPSAGTLGYRVRDRREAGDGPPRGTRHRARPAASPASADRSGGPPSVDAPAHRAGRERRSAADIARADAPPPGGQHADKVVVPGEGWSPARATGTFWAASLAADMTRLSAQLYRAERIFK